MKINLEVTTLDNVTVKATAQFADFIAFETEKNRSVANFQTELKLTDLAWLAWHAQKRTKKTAMKFEEWIEYNFKYQGELVQKKVVFFLAETKTKEIKQ